MEISRPQNFVTCVMIKKKQVVLCQELAESRDCYGKS